MKKIIIESYKFGHDINGNPIAHYIVNDENYNVICSSGSKRKQIGYCGIVHQAAEFELAEMGIHIDSSRDSGQSLDRSSGFSVNHYHIKSINDTKGAFFVEMTDLFCGELNYCEVKRFKVYANKPRGAVCKVSAHTGLKFRAHVEGEVYHSTDKLTGITIEPFNIERHNDFYSYSF